MQVVVSTPFLPRERGIGYSYGKSSVRPSLRLLVYRDHIDRNSSKIISRLVSPGCSLSADLNKADLLQREHQNMGGVWEKVVFGVQ